MIQYLYGLCMKHTSAILHRQYRLVVFECHNKLKSFSYHPKSPNLMGYRSWLCGFFYSRVISVSYNAQWVQHLFTIVQKENNKKKVSNIQFTKAIIVDYIFVSGRKMIGFFLYSGANCFLVNII